MELKPTNKGTGNTQYGLLTVPDGIETPEIQGTWHGTEALLTVPDGIETLNNSICTAFDAGF